MPTQVVRGKTMMIDADSMVPYGSVYEFALALDVAMEMNEGAQRAYSEIYGVA